MRDYADEDYLHARIYGMKSRLLSLSDYVSLAGNPDSMYNPTAGGSDPAGAEEIVFREQISGILPLAEASGAYAPLFLAFLRQFEALNAKLILAKAFGLTVPEQWYDIGPYAVLDRTLLDEQFSLRNIEPLLANTYLSDVLEDPTSYEQIEIRVDMCAAKNFRSASALFTDEGKIAYERISSTRIAVSSVILSLRLEKIYRWDDEKIRLFLERLHDGFDRKARPYMKFVEGALSGHLEQWQSSYAREPSIADMEHYLEQYYCSWISSMFHRDFHSVYPVAAYLWLLFYQIRNLFRIIEGRRFGFSPEHIIGGIVCP